MTENFKYLSKELVSLVYNIELNKSGWWDVALQRLIIGALWISDSYMTNQQIVDFFNSSLHVSIEIHRIQNQVNILCEQDKILLGTNKKYGLKESTKLNLEEEIAKAEAISEYAQNEFEKIVCKECPDLSPKEVWMDLNNSLLMPAIKQMGVKFYEWIKGERGNIDETIEFVDFLKKYSYDQQKSLQIAISNYLSKKDSRIRSFILRQLYTSLVIEANNLDETTIEKFSQTNEKKLSFKIFVDTNFIFSLFGVHDNPFNEDANTLINLIQDLADSIPVKLYASTITVDETRQAIQNSIDYYNRLRLTPNLANASLQSQHLSGFLRKLSIEVAKTGKTLTAQDYYGPYKADLIRILRANGIEFYNTDLSAYKKKQEVIDDVYAQIEFEKEKFGENAKSYEKAEHDIILWHFVKDNRPGVIESPSDAVFWIVTVDFRFLGFDSYKRRFNENAPSICLLPSQLIQLLQFWIPRTPQFEDALFESWLWPLLFQELDKEAEQVTIKILNVLSRYENVGDLPEEVVSEILFNDALRQRIAPETNINQQIELVKLALIESHKKTSDELNAIKTKADNQQDEVLRLKKELREKEQELSNIGSETQESDAQIQKLLIELQKAESKNIILSEEVNEIKEFLQEKEKEENTYKSKRSFVTQMVIYWFLAILLSVIITAIIQIYIIIPIRLIFVAIFVIIVTVWIIMVDKKGQDLEFIKDWDKFIQFKKLTKLAKWIFAGMNFVILSILDKAIGDLFWNPINKLLTK